VQLDEIRAERDNKIARLLRYFGVIMAIFYFVMGLSFMFLPLFSSLTNTTRYAVAILLVVYGIFRMYRLIAHFRIKEE
jgi:uncharacterized membrane protein HdeD (DUF308 family)